MPKKRKLTTPAAATPADDYVQAHSVALITEVQGLVDKLPADRFEGVVNQMVSIERDGDYVVGTLNGRRVTGAITLKPTDIIALLYRLQVWAEDRQREQIAFKSKAAVERKTKVAEWLAAQPKDTNDYDALAATRDTGVARG